MDARAAERVLKAEKLARDAAKAPVPTTAQIRRKMRRQEGMHADLRSARPASADAIGLTEVGEFEQLRGAAVAARLRPGTADGVSTKHHRMKETKGSKFHSKQGGFIPAGRDFGLSVLNPGRGKRRKALAHEVELAGRVEQTLTEVKGSYFPRSKNWSVRANVENEGPSHSQHNEARVAQSQRRVAGGSFVVYQGQPSKLKERSRNQARQMARLQQGCVLTETECEKLRENFVATSKGKNPTISFARFLQVMQDIGIGGHESEVEFFQRLYRVFDTDRNGQVDFEELHTGLSSLLAGSARVKLQMFFDMFFTEERQSAGLSKFNVYKLFMAMLQFFGAPTQICNGTDRDACKWTEVFRTLDKNHDGVVSFEELYTHIIQHEELCLFLDSAVLRFEGAGGDEDSPMSRRESGRGGGAFTRALKESILTNKVASRRSSYSKPWQQSSNPPSRASSAESDGSDWFPSGAAREGGLKLPSVSSASSNESAATASPPGRIGQKFDYALRTASGESGGTPPGSPTDEVGSAMSRGSRGSGGLSVRERPANDSPHTWLLKNKGARKFVNDSAPPPIIESPSGIYSGLCR